MSAHAIAKVESGLVGLPEERVLEMIKLANLTLENASNIEDVKRACSMAEAIATISKKIDLSRETQRLAMRMRIEAEQKLGRLTAEMPRPKRSDGERTKKERLRDLGINFRRANCAERLAKTSDAKIDAVIDGGARTLNGVITSLGLVTNGHELRLKRLNELLFLTNECVETLERAVRGTPPAKGNVAEFRNRLATFKIY